eukprot:s2845_g16.t1
MAASPLTQIEALVSLLEVKEHVDKEVHMKCVITALSTACLDADTALKISAVIEQQNTFTAEDKARLQKAVGDQVREVGAVKKGGRKPYQDYTKVENFLTDEIWDGLMSYPYGRSSSMLLEHAWNLGLRNPSEPTYASLTALLCLFGPPKTGFALSQTYETTKLAWTSFAKKQRKAKDTLSLHLPKLPLPDDLPDVLKASAFGRKPRVESRVKDSSLAELEQKIVMRKSHLLSPKNPMAQVALCEQGFGQQHVADPMSSNWSPAAVNRLVDSLTRLVEKQHGVSSVLPITYLQVGQRSAGGTVSPPSSSRLALPPAEAPLPEMKQHVSDPGLAKLLQPVEESQKSPVEAPTLSTPTVPRSSSELREVEELEKEKPDAVDQAQALVEALDNRLRTSAGKGQPKGLKRPAAAKAKPQSKALKKPAASSCSRAVKSIEKKPARKVGKEKKSKSKGTKKRELKMTKNCVHSRTWHNVRNKIFAKTGDDDLACAKAKVAAKKALDAFLKTAK